MVTYEAVDALCYRFNKIYNEHQKLISYIETFTQEEVRMIWLALAAAKAQLNPKAEETMLRDLIKELNV